MSTFHLFNHPLITHKLTIMRRRETGSKDFRQLLDEITMLMGYEITRDLPLEDVMIETPIAPMQAQRISGKKLAIIPILRAGLGMVDGMLSLVPVAKVGHIGLYRDPETHLPVEYYCKLPTDIGERIVIVVDPMLATGGSASDAISMLKAKGVNSIRLMCLVAAPEGVAKVQADHPDVDIYAAGLDECLNEHAYIVPGLGDAGDRLFGTK
ncbi:MAG: uracil phosphoribosyltransferase [Lachnospiraceae bacterium]